ncbi:hypothetical protein Tco_0499173 [Tanacetum coccineum]
MQICSIITLNPFFLCNSHLGSYGWNTRELGSIREEKSFIAWRRRHQKLATVSQVQGDDVTRSLDGVSLSGGDLIELSAEKARETIDDCPQCDKQWKNPTNIISNKSIANLKAKLVGKEMVRVKISRSMSWLGSTDAYDEYIGSLDMMKYKVENRSSQVLPSFEEYTPSVTYPEEV